jgi:hypothetical protein
VGVGRDEVGKEMDEVVCRREGKDEGVTLCDQALFYLGRLIMSSKILLAIFEQI